MSNTRFARPVVLRMTDAERHALTLAVMTRIELLSTGGIQMMLPDDEVRQHMERLRSLLERLSR